MLRNALSLRPAIVAALLAACASPPAENRPPPASEDAIAAIAARGYATPSQPLAPAWGADWTIGATTVGVQLAMPAAGTALPLVVYLPGLGESPTAGSLWRNAWARAGYAVLAMQPNDAGDALLRSPRARAGDFRGLARERFARTTLPARIDLLRATLDELARRAASDPAIARIDLARVALTGFDLGAQTALAAAAEPARTGRAVCGAIALSPFSDPVDAPPATFAAIGVPALAITATDDLDPYGLLASAAARRQVWQSMRAGDKFELVLAGAGHALVSGSSLTAPAAPALAGGRRPGERFDPPDVERRGRRLDFAGDRMNQAPAGASRRGGRGGEFDEAAARPVLRGFDPAHIAAVRVVSTAFLDAACRGAGAARAWLANDAGAFLDGAATLRMK